MRSFRELSTFAPALLLLLFLPGCSISVQCAGGCDVAGESPGDEAISAELGAFVPLLEDFRLEFVRGDRPPALIGVGSLSEAGVGGRSFRLELADGDGGDAIRGEARYYRWPEGSREVLGLPGDGPLGREQYASRSGCRGSCTLETPGFDSRENVLVITGFRFRYASGENNLRAVGLMPEGATPGSSEHFRVRADFRDDDGAEPFDVELAYVLFPRSWSNRGVNAGTDFLARPNPGSVFETPLHASWRGRVPLLGGFRLTYAEADEHLRELAVEGSDERVRLTLGDDDGAESIHVQAIYWGFCPAPAGVNSHIVECP